MKACDVPKKKNGGRIPSELAAASELENTHNFTFRCRQMCDGHASSYIMSSRWMKRRNSVLSIQGENSEEQADRTTFSIQDHTKIHRVICNVYCSVSTMRNPLRKATSFNGNPYSPSTILYAAFVRRTDIAFVPYFMQQAEGRSAVQAEQFQKSQLFLSCQQDTVTPR